MIDVELAQRAVRLALDGGATDAECTLSEGDEFSAQVRMRSLESLQDSAGRGAGIRVLAGKRSGSAYTSDLSSEGIGQMVRSALDIAAITGDDPHAGLPDPGELGSLSGELDLYSDDVAAVGTDRRIELARETEEAGFAYDPRIVNSDGAGFDAWAGTHVFANSRGFAGCYRRSHCSLRATLVAREGESMERDYWYSAERSFARLEKPADIGRKAGERTVRRLGSRKVATQTVPVVFDPQVARSLLGHLVEAVDGDAIWRKASFLAGRLGERIAPEHVTIVDDGTLPGLFGTQPFDDEGVPTRRTVVVERGILRSYLLNTYAARRLGLRTTGNASRGLTGSPHVGQGNFYIQAGERTPDDIVRGIRNGLYVTELIGSGVSVVTGDYSRGAAGLWIENGEFAYPVSEITIAANLGQMLLDLETVGSDLEFRSSIAAPTLVVREMTISGH